MGLPQGWYRFTNGAGCKMPETCAKSFEVGHLLLLLWWWWWWWWWRRLWWRWWCDMVLRQGWYRFTNAAGGKMPETCAKRFQVALLLLLLLWWWWWWCCFVVVVLLLWWWWWRCCDMGLPQGWYLFTNGAGGKMPETCAKRFEVRHLL